MCLPTVRAAEGLRLMVHLAMLGAVEAARLRSLTLLTQTLALRLLEPPLRPVESAAELCCAPARLRLLALLELVRGLRLLALEAVYEGSIFGGLTPWSGPRGCLRSGASIGRPEPTVRLVAVGRRNRAVPRTPLFRRPPSSCWGRASGTLLATPTHRTSATSCWSPSPLAELGRGRPRSATCGWWTPPSGGAAGRGRQHACAPCAAAAWVVLRGPFGLVAVAVGCVRQGLVPLWVTGMQMHSGLMAIFPFDYTLLVWCRLRARRSACRPVAASRA